MQLKLQVEPINVVNSDILGTTSTLFSLLFVNDYPIYNNAVKAFEIDV